MNQKKAHNVTTQIQDLELNLRGFIEQSRLVNLYQDAYTRNLKVDVDELTLSESDRIKLEYYSEKQDNVNDLFNNYRDNTKPLISEQLTKIKALYNTFNSRLERLLASTDTHKIKKGLSGIHTAIQDILDSELESELERYKSELEKEIDGLDEDEKIIVESLTGEEGSFTKLKEQVDALTKSMAESNTTLAKGAIEQGKAVLTVVKTIIKEVMKGGSDTGSSSPTDKESNEKEDEEEKEDDAKETTESDDKAKVSSVTAKSKSSLASKIKKYQPSDETKGVIIAQIKVITDDMQAQSKADEDWNESFNEYKSILAKLYKENQVSCIILNKSQLLSSLKEENQKFNSSYGDYIEKVVSLKKEFKDLEQTLGQEGNGQWFNDILNEYENQLLILNQKAESLFKYLK